MRLVPIVILVTPDTLRALNEYTAHTQKVIALDAPDVEQALASVADKGWTPSMIIGGQLLNAALADEVEP